MRILVKKIYYNEIRFISDDIAQFNKEIREEKAGER